MTAAAVAWNVEVVSADHFKIGKVNVGRVLPHLRDGFVDSISHSIMLAYVLARTPRWLYKVPALRPARSRLPAPTIQKRLDIIERQSETRLRVAGHQLPGVDLWCFTTLVTRSRLLMLSDMSIYEGGVVTSQRDMGVLHAGELGVNGGAEDAGSLDVAVNAVIAAWRLSAEMSPRTVDKFAQLVRRFTRFAAVRDVTTLSGTDSELIAKFVVDESLLRRRGAVPTAPSVSTMRTRRAALRAFFRTARELGLTFSDPTAEIAVDRGEDSLVPTVRPLNDDEAALVRLFSEHDTPTRHAVTVALLLAGAHTSEVGHIRIRDVNMTAHSVWAHGSTRHRARQLLLDTWARGAVYERIERLTDRGATPERKSFGSVNTAKEHAEEHDRDARRAEGYHYAHLRDAGVSDRAAFGDQWADKYSVKGWAVADAWADFNSSS